MKNWLLKRLAQEIDQNTQQETKPLSLPSKVDITYLSNKVKTTHPELLQNICNLINAVIHYTSSGQVGLKKLKDSNFTLDTTKYTEEYMKQLFTLAELFHSYLNGTQTLKEMMKLAVGLKRINNSNLNNFIGGDFNSKLNDAFTQLYNLDQRIVSDCDQ